MKPCILEQDQWLFRTTLGWILSGPVPWIESLPASTNLITHVLRVNARSRDCDQQLERPVKEVLGSGVFRGP